MRRLIAAVLLLGQGGCVNHIDPYVEKRRRYDLPVPHAANQTRRSTGSLFSENGVGAIYGSDERAQFVNDVVNVIIDEEANAERGASTETSKSDEMNTQLNEMLGLIKELESRHPNFEGSNAIDFKHKADFKGGGQTSRNDKLQGTVPAMVRSVLPNGNLFVEGHRVVQVNDEEQHLYVSGVVRRIDIDQDNTVRTSRMADAEIEYTGRGNVTRATEKGWLSNALDYVWPF